MSEIVWIKNKSGNNMPVINKYILQLNKIGTFYRTYWICSSRTCKVKLIIQAGRLETIIGYHNHSDDTEKIIKYQLIEKIQEKLINFLFISETEAYNASKRELALVYNHNIEILSEFPSYDSLKNIIYRYKNKIQPSALLNQNNFDTSQFDMQDGTNILLYSDFKVDKMVIMESYSYIRRFCFKYFV
ncbi:hypothetical protein DMUE_4996 [Dictyocoela muelleri]|nr:hypothetical protein DMUE_4996 [Dictyocoela muelleri]